MRSMDITIRHTRNEGLIRYLERNKGAGVLPDLREPDPQKLDYMTCGSHPDIVARVWDELGAALPRNARQIVIGSPALIEPSSGVILVLAIGTQYALRLPVDLISETPMPGVQTRTVWADKSVLDVQQTFGKDWILGGWSSKEGDWCLQTYEYYAAINK